jgi:hypothetical protein
MSPAELDQAVSELLDHVSAARRSLATLKSAYARLDASRLAVDELGDQADPASVLAAAHEGLADIDKALGLAADAIYAAMRHTSRLYER